MVLLKGRTAARPNSRAPPLTYPRVRPLGYLPITGLDHFDTGNLIEPRFQQISRSTFSPPHFRPSRSALL